MDRQIDTCVFVWGWLCLCQCVCALHIYICTYVCINTPDMCVYILAHPLSAGGSTQKKIHLRPCDWRVKAHAEG